MEDYKERLLESIDKNLDSMDSTLKDQFTSADGVGYATQQAWARLIEIRDHLNTVSSIAVLILLVAIVTSIAVVAYVIHHW
jgi:uncharacterized membrane protein